MSTITISMVSESSVDARTTEVRYNHPNTRNKFPTTQAWSWEGGDALVSLVNNWYGGTDAYTTLRLGNEVHSVRGSVRSALEAFGFQSKVHHPELEATP